MAAARTRRSARAPILGPARRNPALDPRHVIRSESEVHFRPAYDWVITEAAALNFYRAGVDPGDWFALLSEPERVAVELWWEGGGRVDVFASDEPGRRGVVAYAAAPYDRDDEDSVRRRAAARQMLLDSPGGWRRFGSQTSPNLFRYLVSPGGEVAGSRPNPAQPRGATTVRVTRRAHERLAALELDPMRLLTDDEAVWLDRALEAGLVADLDHHVTMRAPAGEFVLRVELPHDGTYSAALQAVLDQARKLPGWHGPDWGIKRELGEAPAARPNPRRPRRR